MSVGTLVTFRTTELPTEYLPLATESEFRRLWLPLAESRNLQWVVLFESGVSLSAQNIPQVLGELCEMQDSIAASELQPEIKAKMLDRTERLRRLLENLDLEQVGEIFVG